MTIEKSNKPNATTWDVHRCACECKNDDSEKARHQDAPPNPITTLMDQLALMHHTLVTINRIIGQLGDDEASRLAQSLNFEALAPIRKIRDHLGITYPFETIAQLDAFVEYQERYPKLAESLGSWITANPDGIDATLDGILTIIDAADHWISDKTNIERAAYCLFRVFIAIVRAGHKPSEVLNKMRELRGGKGK